MYHRPTFDTSSIGMALAAYAFAAGAIVAAWWQLGRPIQLPNVPPRAEKPFYCVSYAPFRAEQSPFTGSRISAAQIEEDLVQLQAVTGCVRTYSVELGLDQVPEIARRHGMTMLLGLWLSGHPDKNRIEIDTAVALARRYPDVVKAVVVGNEVLLRGEMSAEALAGVLREVKAKVPVPVTYADVWEFWLRNRELAPAVDFVTIHILPYWEDFPVPAAQAAAHLQAIHAKVAASLPGKDILIGEFGWPSAGRMREGALPSPTDQARVLIEGVQLAARERFKLNVIEAYDQPWKRLLEGTVGGHWGLFDAHSRQVKFEVGAPLSDHKAWRRQLAGGLLLAALCVVAALFADGRTSAGGRGPRWAGVAAIAAASGIMIGWAAENALLESLGLGGWLRSGALFAVALLAPVAAAAACAGDTLPAGFADVLARRGERRGGAMAQGLAWLAIATTVLALQAALGLVFDPRYKDFPFAPLSAAVAPFLVLATTRRGRFFGQAPAETAAAAILALSAVYIALNETFANWQALWFSAVLLALAFTLARARAVPG